MGRNAHIHAGALESHGTLGLRCGVDCSVQIRFFRAYVEVDSNGDGDRLQNVRTVAARLYFHRSGERLHCRSSTMCSLKNGLNQ